MSVVLLGDSIERHICQETEPYMDLEPAQPAASKQQRWGSRAGHPRADPCHTMSGVQPELPQ